jgi:hypothetical protein
MSKSDMLLKSITEFYNETENSKMLEDILVKKNRISLRSIERYVTEDSKKNNITYTMNGRPFTVHTAYKSSLGGYSKKYFDPFCRNERIHFKVNDTDIVTTIAQLNFIRWCIKNDIFNHLQQKQ